MRFDDTNPEKEEEKFFTGIEDIVKWLGMPARINPMPTLLSWVSASKERERATQLGYALLLGCNPYKMAHSSDNFDQLYK